MFVGELGQCLAPIVPDTRGDLAHLVGQRGKVRREVITAALLKFREEIAGPIRAVYFQTVAEYRVRRVRAESLHQAVADIVQVIFDGCGVVMVEHRTLGAHRRALHGLASAAGDEDERATGWAFRRNMHSGVVDIGDAIESVAALDKCRDELFALADFGHPQRSRIGRHGPAFHAQPGGSEIDRRVRSAIGPAAAERNIDAHPQLARFVVGETHGIEKAIRKIRQVDQSARRVVERHRIHRLDFHAANAAVLHGAQLAFELGFLDRRAEPPPAHHDPAVIRRVRKGGTQIVHGVARRGLGA